MTSFNEIESKLKEFNCRLNKHYKTYKFFNIIKSHLTSSSTSSSLTAARNQLHNTLTDENTKSKFNYRVTTKSLSELEWTNVEAKSSIKINENITTDVPALFDVASDSRLLVEHDENMGQEEEEDDQLINKAESELSSLFDEEKLHEMEDKYFKSSPCLMADLNKRCNFYRNFNHSYVLSSDYRIGRRDNYKYKRHEELSAELKRRRESNKYETLNLIDNSYLRLNVEFNLKLDFKINLMIKVTNCTKPKSYTINLLNGHITQSEFTDDLVIRSKYNLDTRIKLLFVYFKPFNFILLIAQNKQKRTFSLSIEYPDYDLFNFPNHHQIDFDKFRSTLCNFNRRNYYTARTPSTTGGDGSSSSSSSSTLSTSVLNFNRIKLNNNQLSTCYYMDEGIIENFSVKNLNLISLSLIKQKCKFETLVESIESNAKSAFQSRLFLPAAAVQRADPLHDSMSLDSMMISKPVSTITSTAYREINLNALLDDSSGVNAPRASLSNESGATDDREDESIDEENDPIKSSGNSNNSQSLTNSTSAFVMNYDNIDNIIGSANRAPSTSHQSLATTLTIAVLARQTLKELLCLYF